MSTEKTPFRTDLGMDQNGYYCIKLGHTIYAVRENQVFTFVNGQYKAVPAEVLAEKSWIMRNINEVMLKKSYTAKFIGKTKTGYIIQVNGKDYIALCSFHPTMHLDKDYDPIWNGNLVFNWSDLLVLVDGVEQPADENDYLSAAFKSEFKRALNYQRKIDFNQHQKQRRKDLSEVIASEPWRYSKHEAREYKNKKHNTDAFGIEHK